jgi:hypothetical protein
LRFVFPEKLVERHGDPVGFETFLADPDPFFGQDQDPMFKTQCSISGSALDPHSMAAWIRIQKV